METGADPSRVLISAALATCSFLSISAVRDSWSRGVGGKGASAAAVASKAFLYGTLGCLGGCSGAMSLFVAFTGITSAGGLLREMQKLDAYKVAKKESESARDLRMIKGLFLPIGVASQRFLDRVGLRDALISAEEIKEWDRYIEEYEKGLESDDYDDSESDGYYDGEDEDKKDK